MTENNSKGLEGSTSLKRCKSCVSFISVKNHCYYYRRQTFENSVCRQWSPFVEEPFVEEPFAKKPGEKR